MPEITYITTEGESRAVQAAVGANLMQTAVDEGVDGIVGNCGGEMMCATCHVYVDDAWADRVGAAEGEEDEMLEETLSPRRPTSRLSCQIVASDDLDGLVLHTPEEQC